MTALSRRYRVLLRGTEVLLNRRYVPLLGLAANDTVLTNGLILARFPERLDDLAEHGVTNVVITYPFHIPASERMLADLLARKEEIDRAIAHVHAHPGRFVLQLSCQVMADMLELEVLRGVCDEAMARGADVVRFHPVRRDVGLALTRRDGALEGAARAAGRHRDGAQASDRRPETRDSHPGVLGLFPHRSERKKALTPAYSPDPERLVCPAGASYFAIGAVPQPGGPGGRPHRLVTPCHFRMDQIVGRYYGGDDLEIDGDRVGGPLRGCGPVGLHRHPVVVGAERRGTAGVAGTPTG